MNKENEKKNTLPVCGTSGGCTWTIDESGLLKICPTKGASGMLDNMAKSPFGNNKPSDDTIPWKNYREDILSVIIEQGVIANKRVDYMFGGCKNLISVNLSGLDTSNAADMNSMFFGCANIKAPDLSAFDTGNVIDMSRMFESCSALEQLDLSMFDTKNVMIMSSMFSGCYGLKGVNLNGFCTSNVNSMSSMFKYCARMENIDLSGFDTGKVKDMSNMFLSCANLKSLDLSAFDTSESWYMNDMFTGCLAREYKLGAGFIFSLDEEDNKRQTGLPALSGDAKRGYIFTGKWISASGKLYAGDEIPDGAGIYTAQIRQKN